MPKRTNTPKDENVTAFEIMKAATGDQEKEPAKEKNPAAVTLGRLGGLKGLRGAMIWQVC